MKQWSERLDPEAPMPVMPIVRLFFPCAHLEVRETDGTITIIDPIETILVADEIDAFILGPICVYALIKGGLGEFYFRVEVRNERGKRFAASRPQEYRFSSSNHNSPEELTFVMPRIKVEQPGLLSFELFANERRIAVWELSVLASGDDE